MLVSLVCVEVPLASSISDCKSNRVHTSRALTKPQPFQDLASKKVPATANNCVFGTSHPFSAKDLPQRSPRRPRCYINKFQFSMI
ncbi:hypothetical protein N658DRAFT_492754 [Parathielavia hyrcaniae]|uniref:Uncharacterized protein n=1 Tax=Parathielavia hyrcaniae TaxID=113614 RepID=A0AAN6T5B9_9PEZI|nr:hypothetical protein N658DRAFT_492754 [Parathielavia hyrcaniae]